MFSLDSDLHDWALSDEDFGAIWIPIGISSGSPP